MYFQIPNSEAQGPLVLLRQVVQISALKTYQSPHALRGGKLHSVERSSPGQPLFKTHSAAQDDRNVPVILSLDALHDNSKFRGHQILDGGHSQDSVRRIEGLPYTPDRNGFPQRKIT